MRSYLFTLSLVCLFFLTSCESKEVNADFTQIYKWYYEDISLDKKIEDDEYRIVVDRSEKRKKYLINNFKEEKGIDTKWIFTEQTLEVKTTDFKGSIVEIISYFEYQNEKLCVIDRYFYSLSLLKPKHLESSFYCLGDENRDVNYKSIWNNKLSVF
ncbi:hypothetical protein HX063_05945 [Myroides odoratimimus]|uniref:hypothetical protein n=1 Tax=Myroides odoratimimus TaxID=76832 RepID=UPI0025791609|nr:hypothetical protein [Myroides odoratimimus]MDM1494956.1 hypothetical protein [Myroides odoratimimus]